MDERRALVAAVIADPDVDTPRLALADWFQEHGDEHDRARAEFIRLQVQAARLPEGDESRKEREARAADLESRHRAAWLAPLLAVTGPRSVDRVEFRRGLLSYWFVSTGDFVLKPYQSAAADALAAVGVESLGLSGVTKKVAILASSPAVRWVADFSWGNSETDDTALVALGTSPQFAHLRSFRLGVGKFTDDGLRTFADTATMPRLCRFGLTSGPQRAKYTAAGVAAVLDSDRFPLLEELDVDGSQPSKFGYETLLAAPKLSRLRTLKLGWATPMGALAACSYLTGLRELTVSSTRIVDRDAEALVANPALAGVRRLLLHGINWGLPRLTPAVERRLRDRFGEDSLRYSPEQR